MAPARGSRGPTARPRTCGPAMWPVLGPDTVCQAKHRGKARQAGHRAGTGEDTNLPGGLAHSADISGNLEAVSAHRGNGGAEGKQGTLSKDLRYMVTQGHRSREADRLRRGTRARHAAKTAVTT